MNLSKPEDYDFDFDPTACRSCPGRCCNGASGYVFVGADEIAALAGFLKLGVHELGPRFLRRVESRYSLLEVRKGDNYACVFFDEARNGCAVYPVRPEQCRTFPFWDRFRASPDEAARECPGVRMKRN